MNKLIPIEFKNQRIMTTKVLADEFGTDEGNIQKNFSRNEKRFVEGKHYYKLDGQALKDFKSSLPTECLQPIKFAPILYLWTDRGAARHAKILDTDEAWEVYEQLEETYFRVKQNKAIDSTQLSPELQMFKSIFDTVAAQQLENKQIKQDLNQTKQEVQAMKDVITIKPSEEWRKKTNVLINRICMKTGDYKTTKDEIYKALQERAGCDLKVRLKNMRGRLLLNGATQSKADSMNYLDVIAEDKKLIEIYTAIVKELAIKNSVKEAADV